ncbi:MAG: nicotinate-nucleotide adenylyltransferase [Mariniblastus sp.]|nr:nicotinate-nucleotide adenylyltransferase [Mariniblastus sp.]
MRIGVFGGSFDPVHYGHLLLAEQCREQANLDRVLFLPSAISPFKEQGPEASDKDRLQMLALALAGHTPFEVSPLEIERGGTSYTVDTLQALADQRPDSQLYLLMGADTLSGLPRWKDPTTVCSIAMPLIVDRPGSGPIDLDTLSTLIDPERMEQVRQHTFSTKQVDISSSDIRLRTRQSQSTRYMLPRAVEKYIETKKLYQD